jgi:hypothetical protein
MPRSIYRKVNGKYQWVDVETTAAPEADAPFVHGDTMETPLMHPVTGEVTDSLTRWNQINAENNCKVVGNDLFSKRKSRGPDTLTEDKILDGIERAEAIKSNPDKYSEYMGRQRELLERNERLLGHDRLSERLLGQRR